MSVLRSIERAIEGVVERSFGRLFKSPVQPVELARKLGRSMDENKRVAISGIYGPNEFRVFLSTQDRAGFASFETHLITELSTYLTEHAREQQLTLLSPPTIAFETDSDLAVGEFGIAARVSDAIPDVTPPAARANPYPPAPPAAPVIVPAVPAALPVVVAPAPPAPEVPVEPVGVEPVEPVAEEPVQAVPLVPSPVEVPALPVPGAVVPDVLAPIPPVLPTPNAALRNVQGTQVIGADDARRAGLVPAQGLTLSIGERRFPVGARTLTIGRSRECDIAVADANISREHFEVRLEGDCHVLVDLRSTNGTLVNGERVRRHELVDGDVIQIGTTTIKALLG